MIIKNYILNLTKEKHIIYYNLNTLNFTSYQLPKDHNNIFN